MADETTQLDSPIDVMYLIHKALSGEATRVQRVVEEMEEGDGLQRFRTEFNSWATALMYHADMEDQYMTTPLTDFQPARVNEAEHAELGDLIDGLTSYVRNGNNRRLEERVKAAVVAIHQQQHSELMEKLEDVLDVLNGEIGRTRLIARTRRHLYGKVVQLRICQDDHLESEEAFVLPEVKSRLSEAEQLEVGRRLLIDDEAEDTTWNLDWIAKHVSPAERKLLQDFADRFVRSPKRPLDSGEATQRMSA